MPPASRDVGAVQPEKQAHRFGLDWRSPPRAGSRRIRSQRGDKEDMVFLRTHCGKYWGYVKAAYPSRRTLRYLTIGCV